MSTQPARRLIPRKAGLERLGNTSKSSGQRHVFNHPDFPKPIKLLPGTDLFDDDEINGFIEKLLAERDLTEQPDLPLDDPEQGAA